MKRLHWSFSLLVVFILALPVISRAQQANSAKESAHSAAPAPPAKQQTPAEQPAQSPEQQRTPATEPGERTSQTGSAESLKWDMTETAPVQTRHQAKIDGKILNYTATAGRLPIKDPAGKIEAEMFFVAYTLDGAEPNVRPLTFAFNGGPGSASLWLHMGALGPRKVVLEPEGWMPAMPYQLMEGYYDLATPFLAANYTMDLMALTPELRKNISFAAYDSGHMVYLQMKSLEKMHKDFTTFIQSTLPPRQP